MSFGRVSWPPEAPLWTFLWDVADHDSEGIAFRDVFFRGKKVFHKASLPMIRVQYDSGHGPYKDSLSGSNMQGPVKISEGTHPQFRFLAVEGQHRIGRYRIVNRWIFRSDGVVLPQLHSAGLQHPSNHRHHCYFRFDFDIVGASSNLALEHTNVADNWGYGPGWRPIRFEQTGWHGPGTSWAVLNKQQNIGFLINRGPFDGPSDGFSVFDVWIAAYHGPEDLRGRLGTPWDDQIYQHIDGETVDGTDVVFWYSAHLRHDAHAGGDEWHVCGPILQPFGY